MMNSPVNRSSIGRCATALAALAMGVGISASAASAQSTPATAAGVPGPTTTSAATPARPSSSNFHIGGTLWLDLDGNGVVDPGEPGLAGITVILLDDHLRLLETRATGADGRYDFARLAARPYVVAIREGVPAGAENTSDPDGNSDGATVIAVDSAVVDHDFGFRGKATICSKVERGGRGVAGVAVLIVGPNGLTISSDTGRDGVACVASLFDGEWTVRPTGVGAINAKQVTLRGAENGVLSFALRGTSPPASLAFTGGERASLVVVALLLTTAGSVLIVSHSRHRHQADA